MSSDTNQSSTAEHYDLIVIGTGSGNSIPEELNDRKIAVVEKGIFGGTCINVGCIPTKMYVYTADVVRELQNVGTYGIYPIGGAAAAQIPVADWRVDWKALQQRVFGKRIDPISKGGEEYRRGDETPNITLYSDIARFTGERTLQIGDGKTGVATTITGDQIILATGSRTWVPPVIAESGVPYRTNIDIMRMEELPRTLVILGGGIIATEFAHIFSALGVEVFGTNGHVTFESQRAGEFTIFEAGLTDAAYNGPRTVVTGPEHPYFRDVAAMPGGGVGTGYAEAFTAEIQEFVRAIGEGAAMDTDFAAATAMMRVVGAALESHRSGQAVEIA